MKDETNHGPGQLGSERATAGSPPPAVRSLRAVGEAAYRAATLGADDAAIIAAASRGIRTARRDNA